MSRLLFCLVKFWIPVRQVEISNRKLDVGVWSSTGKVKSRITPLKVTLKLIKERMREKRKLRIKPQYSQENSARDLEGVTSEIGSKQEERLLCPKRIKSLS